jgi:sugar/nucleoside kinase (ribokinase family)
MVGGVAVSLSDFDVVLLGHIAKVKEVVEGKGKDILSGSVFYGAFPLKIIGTKVAIVTKLAKQEFSNLTTLKEVDIPVFTTEASQTTEVRVVYPVQDRDNRDCYPTGFAGAFTEKDFPNIEAQVIHIGALMKGEVPLALIKKLAKKANLGLDVQGFVRVREGDHLLMRDWEEKEIALSYVKYLKADAVEAETLTAISNLQKAAQELAQMGPSEVLITHSGGAVLFAEGEFYKAPFNPRSLEGRTGRGDTCMATYIGKRLSSPPHEALQFAAALTTLKLEKEGPFRGTLQEVRDLLNSSKFAR